MLRIIQGNALEQLRTLWTGSVQCCVTSPPYWGLRDYGTAQWEGGEAGCDHAYLRHVASSNLSRHGDKGYNPKLAEIGTPYKDECGKCGARRIDSQLGLEATPEEYIAKMVAVFREVWRVLREDGSLWLNLGDSYCGSPTGKQSNNEYVNGNKGDGAYARRVARMQTGDGIGPMNSIRDYNGLKPKDLCMMPARLALALQADGWYLRSDIIWAKPNPMPESVTDRPTKAHEYIFLLTKQERYFYDADAIAEPTSEKTVWTYSQPDKAARLGVTTNGSGKSTLRTEVNRLRNKRTVWTIATQPYAEVHFATFPEEIPKLCILAGSKPGDTILDPFGGSGTVGKVALELGRRAILIELNPAYVQLMRDRTFVTPGFL